MTAFQMFDYTQANLWASLSWQPMSKTSSWMENWKNLVSLFLAKSLKLLPPGAPAVRF